MKCKGLIILPIIFLAIGYSQSHSCTNLIVTKGASVDGSVMITYAADAAGFMEPLFYLPRAEHKPGDMLQVYEWDTGKLLGEIPQVPITYRVIGNMNEYQVAIGETTFGGLNELRDTTAIMDYGSLMRIALQRSKTAREAIKVITDLVSQYGYYSSGESMTIADKNEAWILEIISKGMHEKGAVWVARKIPDGYIAAHANQARIRKVIENDPENCLYATDVKSFALKHKFWDGTSDFSFADVYNPLDPGSALFCEGRVWRFYSIAAPSFELDEDYWRAVEGAEPYPLFIKPDKKLSVDDLARVMRDHFEGTEYDMTKGLGAGAYGCPYRWKNLTWQVEGDTVNKYGWERPISTQQSAFTFIAQLRSFLPDDIGGIFWYGVDDAASSCYIPLYACLQSVPKSFNGGSIKEFDFNSAFWVFNLVANRAYTKYSYIIEDIKKVQSLFENKFYTSQPAIEQAALELRKQSPDLAVDFLSDYSITQSESVVDAWRDLWKYITVKYNDGYINDVDKNEGRSPKGVGYGDDFYKLLLKERPGYYDVKWNKK